MMITLENKIVMINLKMAITDQVQIMMMRMNDGEEQLNLLEEHDSVLVLHSGLLPCNASLQSYFEKLFGKINFAVK